MTPVKIEIFTVDKSLAYLIQNITNDSSQEILTYFYGIASFVVDDISKISKAVWLDKKIVLFYKETPISFCIRIKGAGPGISKTRFADKHIPLVKIEVSYPSGSSEFEVAELMNAAVESGLGLADEHNMPQFTRPELKTPRCLRKVRLSQEAIKDNKEKEV